MRRERRVRFARADQGASAAEFALLAPVFLFVLVGAVDFGGFLYTKFSLDSAVSAAGNYGILNAGSVSSTGGSTLATTLAVIVASGHAANWADATVVVNNGPTATLSGGVVTTGGTASAADSCYCPTGTAAALSYGGATTCGSTCASGGLAGKFITVRATHAWVPIFPSFGLFPQNVVFASAVVQAQ